MHYKFRCQCMHHNFRNHNSRREKRETGSVGWGPVQSKQFPCRFFYTFDGGINPIWKLSENSWNLFCLVVPLRHQCRTICSRSIIQYLQEILKSFISQNIRSTFSDFFHPVPLTRIFFSNLKSESRDQMNVGKVQTVQINSVFFLYWEFQELMIYFR